MLGLTLPEGLLKRIEARQNTCQVSVSRNSFIVSMLVHVLDRMDEMDDTPDGESGDDWALTFITSYATAGRPRGAARKVRRVEDGKVFASPREAAAEVGVTYTAIYQAVRGMIKTSAGYHWEYEDSKR